jgi:hypothetical protein
LYIQGLAGYPFLSFLGEDGRIDIQLLRGKRMTLHCPSGLSQEVMDETLRGISEGWLQTQSLITHQFLIKQLKLGI